MSRTEVKAPRYPWRTTRSTGAVNHYASEAARNKGARKHADTDQQPVTAEHWTPGTGWRTDLATPAPGASVLSDGSHQVDGIGWVKPDGTVHPRCRCVSGLRTQHRCHCDAADGTGYCLTHQHVYRRENGIPEPERPRPEPEPPAVVHVLDAPLTEQQAPATPQLVHVRTDPGRVAELGEDGDAFADYLRNLAAAFAVGEITYWSEGGDVYAVSFDASEPPREPGDGEVLIDLSITNTYELYGDVTSYVHGAVVPAPPPPDTDERETWEYDELIGRTGVGHTRGDAWYSGEITDASDHALIGHTFDA